MSLDQMYTNQIALMYTAHAIFYLIVVMFDSV